MDNQKFNKRMKLIPLILLIIFSITLSYCYISLNNSINFSLNAYTNTLKDISSFQKRYKKYIQNQESNKNNVEPLYTDGLTALLSAYEDYCNASKVEVEINGTLYANAEIVSYNIEIQGKIKKSNGVLESEIIVYNASNSGQNSGSRAVMQNGTITETKCKKSSKVNGKLVADYSVSETQTYNAESYKQERGTVPGALFYVISDKTILNTSNFYVKKSVTGAITGYNTDIVLSPTLATTKYTKMLKSIMDGSKNHVFTSCEGFLELNGKGKLKTLKTNEKYNLDYNLFGDAYWPVTITSCINFNIKI